MNCLYLLLLLCCCQNKNNGRGNHCCCEHTCCPVREACECAVPYRNNDDHESRRKYERWEREPRPFPPFPERKDCDCDSGV